MTRARSARATASRSQTATGMASEQPEFDFDAGQSQRPVPGNPSGPSPATVGSASGVEMGLPPSTWREVPQALFLSWPPAMQAAYCRDRDLDAAEHAEGDEWRAFYLRRAEM